MQTALDLVKNPQVTAVNYPDLLSAGVALIKGGVNVIPVNDHKTPALKEWAPYQSRRTTIDELESWRKKKYVHGLAMIGGKISRGLVVFDFDVAGFFERFIEAAKKKPEVRELADLLPIQQTGSGNHQIVFRCGLSLRNDKLAYVPADNTQGREAAIETRAGGGYAVVAPSHCPQAEKHGIKHKQAYRVIQGDFANIPTITDEQAQILLNIAHSLDEMPLTKKEMKSAPLPPNRNGDGEDGGVIGAFNRHFPVTTILERNRYKRRGNRYLAPDSTSGLPGVHIFEDTGRCFSHHSNDALNNRHSHNAFSAFCILEHNDDVRSAIKAAVEMLGPEAPPFEPNRSNLTAESYTPGQKAAGKQQAAEPGKAQKTKERVGGEWGVNCTYAVENGRLCIEVIDGESNRKTTPLANFTARITEEITLIDGLKDSKEFLITGATDTGRPLSPARVHAKDFDSLRWVRAEWGASVSVSPGRSHGAHLVNAILAHSKGRVKRTVYVQTGWHKIGGVWCWLDNGGAIGGGEQVQVDLGENLQHYRLPEPGGVEAARASLRFLDIGPWEITAPLLACVYLAPFADLCNIDFALWLYGRTGSFKSTVAALAQSHYGNFDRTTLPISWFSTANFLEKITFILKDSLCVIDDFNPPANPREFHEMTTKAGRIIYQIGNRSGRGRCASDLTTRPTPSPRSLVISTGEMLLPGNRQSATARYLGIDFDPRKVEIDMDRLSAAQEEQGLYSEAMAAYLGWLAPQLDDVVADIQELKRAYRKAFQSGGHKRIPEIQALLTVGFEYLTRFLTHVGATSEPQAADLLKKAWRTFEVLGERQTTMIEGESPTLKFMATLRELFHQGKIYAESATLPGNPPHNKEALGWQGTEPARNAELVGWAGDSTLYLLPDAVIRVVADSFRRTNDYLSLGKNDLLEALARDKYIEPGKGENTRVKRIQGGNSRVIFMPLQKLFEAGEDDA